MHYDAMPTDTKKASYSIIYKGQQVNDSTATFTFNEVGYDTVMAQANDGRGKLDAYTWIFYVHDPALLISSQDKLAKQYYLYPPSPNPFNPSTKISYEINKPGNVEINVYSINGQKITQLINNFHQSGKYKVDFDGTNYSSGIYIIEMLANNYHTTQKVLLIK